MQDVIVCLITAFSKSGSNREMSVKMNDLLRMEYFQSKLFAFCFLFLHYDI